MLLIEDTDEIQDGDSLLVSGIQVVEENEIHLSPDSADKQDSKSPAQLNNSDLNRNLILLTHQISKLVARMQENNFQGRCLGQNFV